MAEKARLTNGEDADRLRVEIENTRAAMGQTLDEIQARLDPQHLKEQAMESILDATAGRLERMAGNIGNRASAAGRGLVDVARENPIALALIGLGAGWLFFTSRRRRFPAGEEFPSRGERTPLGYESGQFGDGSDDRFDHTRDRVDQAAHALRDKLSDARHSVRSAASGAAHRAGEALDSAGEALHRFSDVASDVGHRVSGVAHSLTGGVSDRLHSVEAGASSTFKRARHQFDDSPWLGAAVALALGAAAGLALPATEREDELVGHRRDELLGRAREYGEERARSAGRMAREVMEDARESARRYSREL
jgi:ElaB/YqjD/DUF883 family membrane-anchored ribosome-binding protein